MSKSDFRDPQHPFNLAVTRESDVSTVSICDLMKILLVVEEEEEEDGRKDVDVFWEAFQ